MSKAKIRPTTKADVPAVKALVAESRLVPAAQIEASLADYLGGDESTDRWLTYVDDVPVAVACYSRERRSQGTWSLYLVAVQPDRQGSGIGTELLEYIEATLAEQGERILLIEISGYDQFRRTRNFCRKAGFLEEARIRECYKPGEDKIIFRKTLRQP